MAANRITGKEGKASHSGVDVPITAWGINIEQDVQNITDSDDASVGFETFQGDGWTRWAGTFEGWVEDGVDNLVVGASAELILLHETDISYTGEAIITGVNADNQVKGEAAKVSYTYQGTGLLTIANPV